TTAAPRPAPTRSCRPASAASSSPATTRPRRPRDAGWASCAAGASVGGAAGVASDDPTEKASGRGLGILRDEGVVVDVAGGELAARARLLNQAFRKHARTGRPWVLFKSAMTLDGKVATRTGDSKWISSDSSRLLAHRWRAACDAVAVG